MRRFWVISGTRALLYLALLMLLSGALLLVFAVPMLARESAQREGAAHAPALGDATGAKETGGELAAEAAQPVLAALAVIEPQALPAEPTATIDPTSVLTTPVNMFAPVPGAPDIADTPPPIEPEEIPAADDIRIEVVRRTPHPTGPMRVLIYHTHTWEAYEPTAQEAYEPTQKWRTKDPEHNVVRVGEALARELRLLGIEVVHDVSDLEPPNLSTAYTRSLELLEQYRQRGETFDCYIDLHRDAYNDSMKNTNIVTVDGKELARLSVLIGKGTGQTGAGFEQKPNWEVNIQLAQRITDQLNSQVEDLARPVITKSGRFNQHVSENAVLIEVGNNYNTLEQALAAMPYLARALERATGR